MKLIITVISAVAVSASVAGAVELGDTAGALSQIAAPELSAAMPKVEAQKADVDLPTIKDGFGGYGPWDNDTYYRTKEKAAAVRDAWKARLKAFGLRVTKSEVTQVKGGYSFKLEIAGPDKVEAYHSDSDSFANAAEAARNYDALLAAMKSRGMQILASSNNPYMYKGKQYYSLCFNYVKREGLPAIYYYHPSEDADVARGATLLKNAGATVLGNAISYIADKDMVDCVSNSFFTRTAAEIAMAKNVAVLKLKGVTILEAVVVRDAPITNWQYIINYIVK